MLRRKRDLGENIIPERELWQRLPSFLMPTDTIPSQLASLNVGEFAKVFLDHTQEIQPGKWKKPRTAELGLHYCILSPCGRSWGISSWLPPFDPINIGSRKTALQERQKMPTKFQAWDPSSRKKKPTDKPRKKPSFILTNYYSSTEIKEHRSREANWKVLLLACQ